MPDVLDPRAGTWPDGGVLGRTAERAAIDQLLASARDGESGVLALTGPPGIGKSTLLQYAMDSARGFRVVGVAGVESEMALAYSGVEQLVLPMLDGPHRLPGPQRMALEGVIGRTEHDAVDVHLVGLAVLSLVADAAMAQPVLVVIDDAQWLDHESSVALSFVGRRLRAERVAMVVASRSARHPSARLGDVRRIDVAGLDDSDARRLVTGAAPAPVAPDVVGRIVAAALGNPLALVELPAALTAEQLAGRAALPDPLPIDDHLRELYAGRVIALGPDEQMVLLLAAAERLGDTSLLRRAAVSGGHLRWEEVVASVEASGLASIAPTVRFRHPLVRSAIYYSAAPADRRRAHAALAAALDADADADRRAWHLGAAATEPDERVAAALEASADRARRRGGAATAAASLWRAAELTPEPARATDRLLKAARAALTAGQLEQVREALARARAVDIEPRQQADAAWTEALVHLVDGQLREAASLLAAVLPHAGPAGSELVDGSRAAAGAILLAGGHLVDDRNQRTIAAATAAPDTRHDDCAPVASLIRGLSLRVTDGPSVATPLLRAAVTALTSDHAQLQAAAGRHVHVVYLDALLAASELLDDRAWDELARGWTQLARSTGALAALPLAISARSWLEVLQGRLGSATSHLAELDDIASATGWRGLVGTPAPASVLLSAWQGDEDAARAGARRAMRDAHERGQGIGIDQAYLALTVLELGAGKYEAALRAAQRVVEHDNTGVAPLALADLVESAARCGETDLARDALAQLSERTGHSGTPWAAGLVARGRALLDTADAADEWFRVSIDELTRTSMATDTARTQLMHGEWLRRHRRRRDAREPLHEALDFFESIGAAAFAARARAELTATGEHVRGRSAPDLALTPQEAQIARLAAAGERNRDIAAQLYISTSTVEYHLRKIFVKLGVSSRTQLAQVDLPT